jgi:DNA-binding transcriptional LysR family regulator
VREGEDTASSPRTSQFAIHDDAALRLASQALRDRRIDVGFVRLPIRAEEIDTIPVVNERLMIVLSEQAIHNAKSGLAALSSAPFILPCRADSASFYDHVFRTCRAAGFVPKVVQETHVFLQHLIWCAQAWG